MKLIIDTANIEKIKDYLTYLPVDGVTTNPSILKKEGSIEFVNHMKEIRSLIGKEKSLHIQTIAEDYEGMIKDARKIVDLIDREVYIKIPVSKDGLAAIKTLKAEGFNITATAIYSEIQALLATELEADYLAPYVNRMSNLNTDPYKVISNISRNISATNSDTCILAASFKNVGQVLKAVQSGSTHVTVGINVIDAFLANANITKAVNDFGNDWEAVHGNLEI
ncbi:fructose-6-phosphate aldolase [Marinilactibacillus psychrotolerans]|uniref:fructose-6-phosphate aldolase n=1 Tax=Marinilactibacillus psychrotolerans TaxID=191770 RepID=UPI00388A0B44